MKPRKPWAFRRIVYPWARKWGNVYRFTFAEYTDLARRIERVAVEKPKKARRP